MECVVSMFALLVCYLAVTGAGNMADVESMKPVFYRQWTACKKGLEYVQVIKREDRVPGERYNERTKPGGFTKTYVCQPCTQCPSGILELTPCSTRADTVCSKTECAVEECILDPMLASCRLPGDPANYPSISAMMDPCDPTKFAQDSTLLPTTQTKVAPLVEAPPKAKGKANSSNTVLFKGDAARDANRASSLSNKPPSSGWDGKDTTIIVVSMFAVGLVVSVLFLLWKYRFFKKGAKRSDGTIASSPPTSSV